MKGWAFIRKSREVLVIPRGNILEPTWKAWSGKLHDYGDAMVFKKLQFQNGFCLHENERSFQISPLVKSVFEKLRTRDGLVWAIRPVFKSRKICEDLKICEPKPPIISRQYVVYNYKCDLRDAEYVGYTRRHLHQRIDEHRYSAIGKHLKNDHGQWKPSETLPTTFPFLRSATENWTVWFMKC